MTTHATNPCAIDLTPPLPGLSCAWGLVAIDARATSGDAIKIAHQLSIEALQITESWPSRAPIPAALIRQVRDIEAILFRLDQSLGA